MAYLGITDTITDDENEDESLPWDPFWEFLLGDAEYAEIKRKKRPPWGFKMLTDSNTSNSTPGNEKRIEFDQRNVTSSTRTDTAAKREGTGRRTKSVLGWKGHKGRIASRDDGDNDSFASNLSPSPRDIQREGTDDQDKGRKTALLAFKKTEDNDIRQKGSGLMSFRRKKKESEKEDDTIPWAASFSSYAASFSSNDSRENEKRKLTTHQSQRPPRFGLRSLSGSTKETKESTRPPKPPSPVDSLQKQQDRQPSQETKTARTDRLEQERDPPLQADGELDRKVEHILDRKWKENEAQLSMKGKESIAGQSEFGMITLESLASALEPWIGPPSSEYSDTESDEIETSVISSTRSEEENTSCNNTTEDERSIMNESQKMVETNEVLLKYSPPTSFPDSLSTLFEHTTTTDKIKETFKPIQSLNEPPFFQTSKYYGMERPTSTATGVSRVIKCFAKDDNDWDRKPGGYPVNELSREELAEIFPKLRSVSEEKRNAQNRSQVIGNSNSFEKDLPAHVQVFVAGDGTKSLYEYEYESGQHQVVVYEKFGNDPKTLLKIQTTKYPPQVYAAGLIDFNRVIVQVEASTVSQTDCLIRSGSWRGPGMVPLPNTPGVDMVGKLYRIDKESSRKFGLYKGDRVLSLTKWGGNSRYLAVKPDQLVKVPEIIDPAEAACLPETYLAAFQILHIGQRHVLRYRPNSLKGKSFLVVGVMSTNLGRAVAQLAAVGGAESVYATAKQKHFEKLSSVGILPLSFDSLEWHDRLRGRIDVAISFDVDINPLHYKLLNDNGEIVVVTRREVEVITSESSMTKSLMPAKLLCRRTSSILQCRMHTYDVFNEFDQNLELGKKDLHHLVALLEEGKIQPNILERIPMTKVARAQQLMGVKRVPGFIVCEPWLVTKSRAVCL